MNTLAFRHNHKMYKEYNTKFTSDQPSVGTQCPVCNEGFIESNNFTDKKGNKWYSVKCENCLVKWLSKFPPKGEPAEVSKELDQGELILGGINQLKEGIKVINDNLKNLIELIKNKD